MNRWLLTYAMLAASLFCTRVASAQVDPWEFEVYPYATEGPGILEMEIDNAVVANGHNQPGIGTSSGQFASDATWYNEYEFTYGLTDRIEAAAYLTLALPRGHGYQYSGSKYRLRGHLFDEDVLPVNLGWYLELEWHKVAQFDDNELELEMRPIIEKDLGRFSIVLNPKFEKPIFVGPNKNKGFQFGYANGLYYRWRRYLSPGLEFYGGIGTIDDTAPLHEQQHYVFPVLWGSFRNGIAYSVGPGIGLTRGSDRVIIKFNVELEKYVGAIIKSASDQSWFY